MSDKETVSIVLKKDNINRLRFIRDKFKISMSGIVDGLLDDFFWKYRREMDDEEFLSFFEKYMMEKKVREAELKKEKEKETKKSWLPRL